MLSYRTHVYSCAMVATAEATKLALALSMCVAEQLRGPDPQAAIDNHLPGLVDGAASLRSAVDAFTEALPPEADSWRGTTGLSRHLWFIDKRLNEKSPALCAGDPIDIASNDLPEILKEFERWYEQQSPIHTDLGRRLYPHIAAGQLNSALREAWPFFKTRMVEEFGLTGDLDGHDLVNKLFGNTGATADLLPNSEREGYLNLFKGLYALNRNPVSHNDVQANPEYAAAVLALINSTLLRVEMVVNKPNPEIGDSRST